jgi:hypothetical protein
MVKIRTNVLIVGLATKVATLAFFLGIVWHFHNLKKEEKVRAEAWKGWRKAMMAVYISSALIIVSFELPMIRR